VFQRHFTCCPVCVPARVSELCGRYPHQTGVLTNSVAYGRGHWPAGQPSFPEVFAANGDYQTANFGKTHTPHHDTWQTNWHFESFACCWYNELRPGWDEDEHHVLHAGHRADGVILSGVHPEMPHGRTTQGMVVEKGLEWLDGRDPSRPFLLRCSFLAPHTPVLPDRRFYQRFNPDQVTFRRPSEAELGDRPEYERGGCFDVVDAHSDAEIRRMRASYLALVAAIDEAVGILLAGMKDRALLADTIVVYNSDHGNLIGEHGRFQKGVFYDETTRVPLILAGPGVPKGTVDHLTEAVDLAPTLFRLTGVEAAGIEAAGRDLLAPDAPRSDVIGEYHGGSTRWAWIRTREWAMDWTISDDGRPLPDPRAKDGKLNRLVEDPAQEVNRYRDPGCRDVIDHLETRFHQRTASGRVPMQLPR
jgi:choline-sulfatase